jgi:PilZ domain
MTPTMERSRPVDAGQLNVVKSCHDYALLHMHDQVGLRLTLAERRMLKGLRRLLEGDTAHHRRHHRRLPLMMPVFLRTRHGEHRATAINISGGGLYVMSSDELPESTTVDLVFGPPRERYRFTGVVMWTRRRGDLRGLGIRFSAVPLLRSISPHNQPIVTDYSPAA